MDRVFTADGPGVVIEVDTRQGTTWFHVEGAAMSGWYPAREVTADIGDPGRTVTDPSDFPDPEDGARLPYDPRARDVFHNQLTIQPIADLPENLTPTNSIKGLRYHEPNSVFGASDETAHPFGKQRHARHFADKTAPQDHDLGVDDPKDSDLIDGATEDDPYPHVPKEWKDAPPGVDDYGKDYDKKNPEVVNPPDDDGPFKTSYFTSAVDDLLAQYGDLHDSPGGHGGPSPITPPPDPYQQEEQQGNGKYPKPPKFADLNDRDEDRTDWNYIPSSEELDHPFARDRDESEGEDEDFHREAAGLDYLLNDDAAPNPQQVPWDPSHTMTPGGDMQVFSPDMDTHDDDPAGRLQQVLQPGAHEQQDDPLQGIPVPHQPDIEDELGGIPVPHIGPDEVARADGIAGAGQTGNLPVGHNEDALAHLASDFLQKTAAKNYSDAEQAALMNEAGVAAQLPSLHLSDSIYEDTDPIMLL
jgi:hypothetical protein